ncbi:MAG: CDP-alcohol phosphatidyltransferase family protein [Candidatus Omnitrophica bacterium]|nr:CDP-alcohol phosphatidyltransferase family protein [Candidatus Omnitrophota bacterium]
MGLANKITIARILLVPALLLCLLYYSAEYDFLRFIALAIFLVCGVADAIDGYVARRFYQKTELGTMLDPIADKLLILTAFISLSIMKNIPAASRIPPWLTTLVISRDGIIILGTVLIFLMVKKIDIKPSIPGKITTFFQMVTVLLSLLQIDLIYLFWWITAITTIISGAGYVWYGTRILNEQR